MEYHLIEFSFICFLAKVKLMLNSISDGDTQIETHGGQLKIST